HRLQGQHAMFVGHADVTLDRAHLAFAQLLEMSATQLARELDVAVADALQPADHQADRFPHAADFAIAAFLEGDAEPAVAVAATDVLDTVELCRAVIQLHAFQQLLQRLRLHFAVDTTDV